MIALRDRPNPCPHSPNRVDIHENIVTASYRVVVGAVNRHGAKQQAGEEDTLPAR